jgi:hypothetical protein
MPSGATHSESTGDAVVTEPGKHPGGRKRHGPSNRRPADSYFAGLHLCSRATTSAKGPWQAMLQFPLEVGNVHMERVEHPARPPTWIGGEHEQQVLSAQDFA